ncbi:hypothetical protein [Pseudocnuella soli]|uniref:hypothetical protein n=1 Tax=Pseudocnuella soli TaxID=2502779 RepID=UPI00104B1829|nr:hypothetical protein [Pseudocnuella soli]
MMVGKWWQLTASNVLPSSGIQIQFNTSITPFIHGFHQFIQHCFGKPQLGGGKYGTIRSPHSTIHARSYLIWKKIRQLLYPQPIETNGATKTNTKGFHRESRTNKAPRASATTTKTNRITQPKPTATIHGGSLNI